MDAKSGLPLESPRERPSSVGGVGGQPPDGVGGHEDVASGLDRAGVVDAQRRGQGAEGAVARAVARLVRGGPGLRTAPIISRRRSTTMPWTRSTTSSIAQHPLSGLSGAAPDRMPNGPYRGIRGPTSADPGSAFRPAAPRLGRRLLEGARPPRRSRRAWPSARAIRRERASTLLERGDVPDDHDQDPVDRKILDLDVTKRCERVGFGDQLEHGVELAGVLHPAELVAVSLGVEPVGAQFNLS